MSDERREPFVGFVEEGSLGGLTESDSLITTAAAATPTTDTTTAERTRR